MGWRWARWSGALWGSLVLLGMALPVCGSKPARAQSRDAQPEAGTVDLAEARQPIAVVSTQWRFHAGNEAGWARPEFDDSGWPSLNPMRSWVAQGYKAQGEEMWFRFRLRVPPNTPALVLQMPNIRKNYAIFADGQRVAQVGFAPGSENLVTSAARVFTLPTTSGDAPHVMQMAIHFWRPEQFAFNSPDVLPGPVVVGQPQVLLPLFARAMAWSHLQNDGMKYTKTLIELPILAAALLLLYLTRQRFYFWFGVNMAIEALSLAMSLSARHFGWPFRDTLFADIAWDFAGSAALALFLAGYLELPSLRLVYLAILAVGLAEVGPLLVPYHLPALWANVIYLLFSTTSNLLLVSLAWRAWRAGARVAGLFLVPFCLSAGVGVLGNLGYVLLELHVPGVERWIPSEMALTTVPFRVTLDDLASIVSLFGFLALLVVRFARTNREQQRLAASLQAAHEIQTRLVPTRGASLDGLKTEVVYLAAEEVGGDFCQVLPRGDGSVLAVIGDVSGKGLQAAMFGAVAVGALRSLVEEAVDPATVLARLNDVMVRSDQHGFVTCLCLEIRPDGEMTVANAGHLAPYVNGVEVACVPGLPLGLMEGLEYQQTQVMLPAVARLTLLSDGVVEARSRSGELFGFTRTEEISRQGASEIAAVAQRFGQQDDITVVTLDWTSVMVAA